MQIFISGKIALIQKIDNSLDLRRIFTNNCNAIASDILRKHNLLVMGGGYNAN